MKKLIYFIVFIFYVNVNFAQNLDSGLVAWWPFNGNANDVSGNGNNGIINGNVTLTTDRYNVANSAYQFGGTPSDYINGGSGASIQVDTMISISLWMLMNGGYISPRIISYEAAGYQGYQIATDGTSNVSRPVYLTFVSPTGGGIGGWSPNPITALVWHHIVFVADGLNATAYLYLDGTLVKTYYGNQVLNVNYSGYELNIGRMNHPAFDAFGGKLDDIRIWKRVITQAEVTILYQGTPVPPVLISPLNNSVGISPTLTLVWNIAAGANGYKVKISVDSTFTSVTDSANVTTNQYSVPAGRLAYNTKNYWKVAGYNTYGTGPYSVTWNFTTLNPLPAQVTLLSPANGSSNVSLTPTLFWDTASNAVAYKVEVSSVNNFTLIVDSATVTTNQRTIPPGKLTVAATYFWRVRGLNSYGNGSWSVVWNFSTLLTGIEQISSEIPKEYKLYTNYPNPFNPLTKIKFDIKENTFVKLKIYNILGKEIKTIVNGQLNAGTYLVNWNASSFSSGIYFYRIETKEYIDVRRMILVK